MSKNLENILEEFRKKRLYELLNYNKKQHLKLLNNLDDEFEAQQRRIYSIILMNHLNWEVRHQYLELLENYLEEKIGSLDFRIAFSKRYKSIEKVSDILESNRVLLSPDKNSLNFGNLLSKIDNYSEAYSDNVEPFQMNCEITEVEFRILMEEVFLKMQNLLNEE